MTEPELIAACQQDDRRAQQMLYDQYAPLLFGVCKRYVKNREDAEDVLVEAFFKILTHIGKFKGEGSFEGWMRRITINEALMFLRKQHNFNLTLEINPQLDGDPDPASPVDELAAQDILNLLDGLPTGYRTVFNLYAIEGFKHREIAEMLGISINTSKSQLILAKKRLQELLEHLQYPGIQGMN
ncbi:MAG TPA: RNA polymerase sigma factor [Saprospiraceae bacterium]|nr:RNA polymerase sigma factor [Saprospiraceae bacterium]HMP25869.1 RNA polymerase sigma factor [Saprospiraceae bacterium]